MALLSASLVTPTLPLTVNLTTEGTADWRRWGRSTASSDDRKALVPAQVGTLTALLAITDRLTGNTTDWPAHAFSDGTPTTSAAASPAGIFFADAGNGFEFDVSAGTTRRTLRVYVGAFNASVKFELSLSSSTEDPVDLYEVTLTATTPALARVLTATYYTDAPGEALTVRGTLLSGSGHIAIQAATLQADDLVPTNLTTTGIGATAATFGWSAPE